MATIESSDIIFATIRQRGQILTTLRLSGITSLSEIVSSLHGIARGLTTIDLRNGSQGWSSRHTVLLAA